MTDTSRRYMNMKLSGNRDMRDMRRNSMRDMRNAYGSRGGYVSSSRPDRMYYDERMNYDRSYAPDMRGGYYEGEFRGTTSDHGMNGDFRMMRNDYGDFRNDYRDYGSYPQSDYAASKGRLSDDELMMWKEKLCQQIDKSECDAMSREKIIGKAKEMGIRFDEFSEDELCVTTLMMYTDYCKTIGKGNIATYIMLANDFLKDEDAAVRGGEKLAAYYDHIVS